MTGYIPTRRGFLAASATVGGAAALAGCSFDKGSGGGGKDGGTTEVNLSAFGPVPTFVNNFNPFSPADGVVGSQYLYDPLMYADINAQYALVPWIAESIDFDAEKGTATVKLRDDATWSDGEKVTADDIVYTVMDLPKQAEEQKANATAQDFEVKAVDDVTLEVTWPEDAKVPDGDQTLAALRPYPRHVFEKEDLAKFTNEAPVTSSPLTLKKFTAQRVAFDVRTDHFMGTWDHIKQVNWTPFGSAEIGKSMVLQGTLDWATMSMQNAQDTIVEQGNHYWTIEGAGAEGIVFNTAKAPFDDKAVRTAIYAALDTDEIHSLFDIGLKSTSPVAMDQKVFGDAVLPEYATPHEQDKDKAKKALADAGWTVEGGALTKDGTSHKVSFKTVADYVNWSTWADGVKAQLKDVLGLDVSILKVPDAQIWDQYAEGDFDFGMTWVAGGPALSAVFADLHSKNYVKLGEKSDANYGRVKNPDLDELLDASRTEYDESKLVELSQKMQKIVAEECYWGPFNPSASFVETSGKNWTGFPAEPLGKGDVIPRPYGPEGWKTMQKLSPAS